MPAYKCKMCGAQLEVNEEKSVITCEYCDTAQTIPTTQDNQLENLYNRANTLRLRLDFDKATETYEKIVQINSNEAEAYWGLVLCKYGIHYEEDPATKKMIPTCNRASYDSILADEDYKMALEYADISQKVMYEEEAKVIADLLKEINLVSQKEDPFDIFISYKEKDEDGKRTQDSIVANDIYYQLTQEGYKVFYAAITLEDKIGKEFEPIIFSALNTAKVMLVVGTKAEYFNAPWVKNEWSRYLKIVKKDRSKMIFPCYRDMDPYDLPVELAHLQAQDMSKIGFVNDLVRGIKKVVSPQKSKTSKDLPQEPNVSSSNVSRTSGNANSLIKRGYIELEDRQWTIAREKFVSALDMDPTNSEVYLGLFCVSQEVSSLDDFFTYYTDLIQRQSSINVVDACKEDVEHVNTMVSKHTIMGYLEPDAIEALYQFDRTYQCECIDVSIYKAFALYLSIGSYQREKINHDIGFNISGYVEENDVNLKRAFKYSSKEAQNEIETKFTQLIDSFYEVKQQIDERNNAKCEKVVAAYRAHVVAADSKVLELYNERREKRERDYNRYVTRLQTASQTGDFIPLEKKFSALGNYRESRKCIDICNQKLVEIDRRKRQQEQETKERVEKELQKDEAIAKVRHYFMKGCIWPLVIIIALLLLLSMCAGG